MVSPRGLWLRLSALFMCDLILYKIIQVIMTIVCFQPLLTHSWVFVTLVRMRISTRSTEHSFLEVGSWTFCFLIRFVISVKRVTFYHRTLHAGLWSTRTSWLRSLSFLHVVKTSLCNALSRSPISFRIQFGLASTLAQFLKIGFGQTHASVRGL